MKTSQQEEMEKLFREWTQDTGEYRPMHSLDAWGGQWEGFKEAYTLQQEKIEKLEKLRGVHFNENGMHEIESYEKQIESLKNDLDWATQICNQTLRHMPSLSSQETMNHLGCMDRVNEIRQRHCLDKSEEV